MSTPKLNTRAMIRQTAEEQGWTVKVTTGVMPDSGNAWESYELDGRVTTVEYTSKGNVLSARSEQRSAHRPNIQYSVVPQEKGKKDIVLGWLVDYGQSKQAETKPSKPVVRYLDVEKARANFAYMLQHAVNEKARRVWERKLAALNAA